MNDNIFKNWIAFTLNDTLCLGKWLASSVRSTMYPARATMLRDVGVSPASRARLASSDRCRRPFVPAARAFESPPMDNSKRVFSHGRKTIAIYLVLCEMGESFLKIEIFLKNIFRFNFRLTIFGKLPNFFHEEYKNFYFENNQNSLFYWVIQGK